MTKVLAKSPSRQPPAESKRSLQYDLFTKFFGDSQNLSNTIELWDAIPKYAVSARVQSIIRDEKGNLPVYEQEFEYRPTVEGMPDRIACKVMIQPASIKNKDGSYTYHYPSTDEELVEEVLKKIFTDQNFGHHEPAANESWVRFTLYMIQQELKARGKTRSLDEIKTSLEILSRATYEVQFAGQSRKMNYTSTILSDMVRTTKADYLEDPKSLWTARLPALISQSINSLTYRQINYKTLISLPTPLARWFHRRLTHQYSNAHILHPYNLLYSSIERDSGLLKHSRKQRNIQTVDATLQQLQEANIIMYYKKEERREGRKIADILYVLTPTNVFVDEIKAANARQREHRKELAQNTNNSKRLR
ncbi:MAG: hypothetical protein AB7S78_14260 [Candidatus Omnitrophota bacterium]